MSGRNREILYRLMYSCTDRNGIIQRSQQDMADLLDISYQQLSKIYKEFVEMGMLEKDKHKFILKYHPDEIPWDGAYKELRNKYIEKIGSINVTKSERSRRENSSNIS